MNSMSVGQNIQKICKDLGISITELADLANMSERTVRSITSDEVDTKVSSIKKLIIALGVSADMVLFDDEELGKNGDLKILFREIDRWDGERREYIKKVIRAIIIQEKNDEINQ